MKKLESNESTSSQGNEMNSHGELRTICYKYEQRSTQHVTSSSSWVSQLLPENSVDVPVPYQIRKQLKTLAQRIHNDDAEAYKLNASKIGRYGNKDFHKAIFAHGTTKDKMAAYMYKVMEAPVYNVNEMFSLIDFVNPNHKGCHKVIVDIASVFETTLLPNNHVAREFECHDFTCLIPLIKTNFEQVEKQLVLWYFEDQVHLAYLKLLENIEKLMYDSQSKVKTTGAKGFQTIFKNHPRQDTEVVLQKLINKLGDKNKVTKGFVLHLLTNIQHGHPDLKITLISLVEEFLHRPNVGTDGQYAGLCFLRDVVLSNYDECVAEKLVKIYFDFFEMCSKKGDVDSRFMATILRGLNRAYPYLKEKNLPYLDKQINALYKLFHYVNFNVGAQALQLIYQVQGTSDDVPSDRFYSVIYDKLLDPEFGKSSYKSAFLNIIFRSMVRDNNRNRICAFLRRLLQIARYHPSEVASGVLFLISETIKDNMVLKNDIYSLLMMGFSNNNCNIRVKSEEAVSSSDFPSDDENEYYSDLDTDGDDEDDEGKSPEKIIKNSSSSTKIKSGLKSASGSRTTSKEIHKNSNIKSESSWVHKDNWQHSSVKKEIRTRKYDAIIRNPLYCGADLLPFWELAKFKHHFHPTVSLFASQLLDQIFVEYSGDPLEDLSLTRFLNRFVQRNPKKIKPEKNKIGCIFGSKAVYVPKGSRKLDISSTNFKKLEKRSVAPEEVFLHNYFTEFRKNKDEKKRKRADSDDEDADDDLFDKILKKKMSGYGDLGDEDEDDNFDYASKVGAMKEGGSDDEDENMDGIDDDEEEDFGSEEDFEEFNTKGKNTVSDENDNNFDLEEDFGSDGYEDFSEEEDSGPSLKKAKSKIKDKSYGDWNSKLVDADDISHLFEQNDKFAGTSEAVLNKDKANAGQLDWESSRFDSNKESFKGRNKSYKKVSKGNIKKGGKGNFKKGSKGTQMKGRKGKKK